MQLGSYKTLTTNRFTGAGGEINMNTFLGADGSPSDQIVITGTASSTTPTSLMFHNTGGPGLETTGNGIQVVRADGVGGTTAANTFVLNGEARAGAFDYFLFRGGLNPTNQPNDWFLRSSFIVGPIPPEPPIPPIIPPIPPEPPPGVLPPGVVFPIIGPELATYGVVQPIARQMGLTTLGTLHERIGDTLTPDFCQETPVADSSRATVRTAPVAPTSCAPSGWAPSVWARGFGQQVSNHYQAFADPRADGSIAGIQSGFDLWRGALFPWGRDAAGIYFAYGNANIDVNGLVTNPAATGYMLSKTGTLNINGWSGGAYWTHYGPSGWYLDVVLQGTAYEGSASTQFARLDDRRLGFHLLAGGRIPNSDVLAWTGLRSRAASADPLAARIVQQRQ